MLDEELDLLELINELDLLDETIDELILLDEFNELALDTINDENEEETAALVLEEVATDTDTDDVVIKLD